MNTNSPGGVLGVSGQRTITKFLKSIPLFSQLDDDEIYLTLAPHVHKAAFGQGKQKNILIYFALKICKKIHFLVFRSV